MKGVRTRSYGSVTQIFPSGQSYLSHNFYSQPNVIKLHGDSSLGEMLQIISNPSRILYIYNYDVVI